MGIASLSRWLPSWRSRVAIPSLRRDLIVEVSHRTRQVLLLAGATGAVTGVAVAGFERLTADFLLAWVIGLPVAIQAAVPLVGLVIGGLILRVGRRTVSPATSDEYIRAFHDVDGHIDLGIVPRRIAAAVATLGVGGPLGYEGPALYAGAAVGSAFQRRFGRRFTGDDAKVLLVAGAAAGVAAIFKAPVTGLVFALEVPYQEDLARRMLLPAAISAAASYVVFAAIAGTEPILPVSGQPPFNLVDLGGAAVIGLFAGCFARLFVFLLRRAKTASVGGKAIVRLAIGGTVLAGTVLAGHALGDGNLVLGPGYEALRWALEPQRAVLAIIVLGTLRVAGTLAVILAGGTGGLFIPLVIQGALVGRAVGGIFEAQTTTLFPVVGMAAFLGAGYRVPLAAVVFVAEFTGRPGFVVPGLIAAVVAQLVMGDASVSAYQVVGRLGHAEKRMEMPLSAIVEGETRTTSADVTIHDLFWHGAVGVRDAAFAVVDGDGYLGVVYADDVGRLARDLWSTTTVGEVMRSDVPVVAPTWLLRDALAVMKQDNLDQLAVCAQGEFVGFVTRSHVVQLDEILGTNGAAPNDVS